MGDSPARPRPQPIVYVLAALAVVGCLLCSYLGVHALRACRDGRALYGHIVSLRGQGNAAAGLADALPAIQRDLHSLQRDLAPFLWALERSGWLPAVGPSLAAIPPTYEAAVTLVDLGVIIWEAAGDDMLASLEGADDPLAGAVQAMSRLGDISELDEACTRAGQALVPLAALEPEALLPPLREPVVRLQSVLPLVTAGLEAMPALPKVLERPGDWCFLLLAQNDEELRATGGFISSVGEFRFDDGVYSGLVFRDSYQLDNWTVPHPEPPRPLQDYMDLDLWVTRDANFWPDFPTSAEAVANLYELEQGRAVAGIMALDLYAASTLLDTLTPLELPNGERLEKGHTAEGLRGMWDLPKDALLNDGVLVAPSRPFVRLEVELAMSDKFGEVWFDSVSLERADKPGTNLVPNGSLEEDANGDRLPDGWEAIGLTASDGLVEGVAHGGKRSLHVVGEPGVAKRLVVQVPLSGEAGEEFRLSAMSRAAAAEAKGGPYAAIVRFIGADGQVEEFVAGFAFFEHDWASAGTERVAGEWWAGRKDFVALAFQAALHKLFDAPASVPWFTVLSTGRAMLDERHIQLYSVDKPLQRTFLSHGWAGALPQTPGDYLLVVDTNVGYNKVSGRVQQALEYEVDLTNEEGLAAHLTITYENTSAYSEEPCNKFAQYGMSYEALTQGCYWDYVRVYVPTGARLVSSAGGDEPWSLGSECGRQVFSTYMVLRPGERRTLSLEYTLPPEVVQEGRYELLVQKQAGTLANPLRLAILGVAGTPTEVPGMSSTLRSDGVWVYDGDLRLDRRVVAPLRPS